MRRKAGLHKRVSSIFEDLNVSGRKNDSSPQPEMPPEEPSPAKEVNKPAQPQVPPEESSPVKDVSKLVQPEMPPEKPSPIKETVKSVEPPKEHETQMPKPPVPKEVVNRKVLAVRGVKKSSKQKEHKINHRIVAASIVALCIISVVVAVSMFGMDIFRGFVVTDKQPHDSMVASEEILMKVDWSIPDELPHDMRDIMSITRSAAVVYEEEKSEIVVRGILFSADQPSAIIGLDILHVGDEIMGAKIAKITRKAVEFEKDGEIWEQTVER